jgi:NADPH2:quinone reductase
MKAIRVDRFGSAEVLHYQEVPTPEPGGEEVLVKIGAAGVNFVDIYFRKGQYAMQTPFIPGREGAGEVVAVGPGVTGVREGDRVAFAMQPGTYAEYVSVTAEQVVPLPLEISTRQAAAVMLQGLTAHYLSHSTFRLEDWHTALVHAAAGGVGALLVQMAKRRGARVIGTTSTEEKAAVARAAGADEVILYTETDFEQETRRLTGGEGVDVVYDSVGKATFEKSLNSLKPRGYLVLFGQASGPVEPFDPQVLNRKGSLFLTRPSLGDYVADREELLLRAQDLFRWIAEDELEVRIDRTFSLAEAEAAHRYMEGRNTKGKLLLLP